MILVKLINNGCSSPPEWAAIEVQGELESRHHSQLECQYIGDLFATIKDNAPILIIGHHILYGKMLTFEKPLAVMRKKGETEEYIVEAIVTKKLLFKDRPKPIIANAKKS
ncbi:chromosome transmission fidelity protein 8 homolog isoform X2 [Sipha flava]|jgi:chromosome transmission fidelity protein 8|nr:chromosome transmission fidelity protein 8 homolog isoform X2 [Sipha flava]XP_025411469.1 chromosome transmission fidelity protein 8 homolog isoform X2 [Sipha flava]XP_025411470.1 chromosome transmission fidelity protein 8 homolog isoform X2 [Sipha flava]